MTAQKQNGEQQQQQLILTGQCVVFDDERADEILEGTESLAKFLSRSDRLVVEGTSQTKTIYFHVLPASGGIIKGLRMTEKTYKGKLGPFCTVTNLGDFKVGEHSFTFPKATIPDGVLVRGKYENVTEYADASGNVLAKFIVSFRIVKQSHFKRQETRPSCAFEAVTVSAR